MTQRKKQVILALDTSGQSVSVAVLDAAGDVLGWAEQPMDRGQGEALMAMIQQVLAAARKKPADLTGIAAAVGPGSFTGVRIGLAAARGLGLALGVPVYGATNCEAAAFGLMQPVAVVLDTKRGDYYAQLFDKAGQPAGAAGVKTTRQLERLLPRAVVGDGAERLRREIGCAVLDRAVPSAVAVGRIALGRLDRPLPPDPVYLREADVIC
ncbi:MAG: tRNA (adenosine(37)-N6)-threonylcarbamoyltransferase complex dimerization subunit type 1 TsaB [Alphaproteobacteria bacterium]|nr:tRNA (adenosine(37)-N6)-threonylcarbamoyltransferase complex dimerization subunit type 1 TsaB [Alphaproteobacteria bacterium]